MKRLYSLFGFDPAKHSVKVEIMAGLTTFFTMSYILAVNPLILSATGMDRGALFSATVIASVVATLIMSLYAKLPFALAPGMGPNAFFAYTLVVLMGFTWQQALAAVFIEGIFFIVLNIFKIREAIINSIPINIQYAISVGIGIFIAYLGLQHGGLIITSESTTTTLGSWTPTSIIAVAGILLGAILISLKVKGALLITIIVMTIVGIPCGVTQIPDNFSIISLPASIEPIAFHVDFSKFLTFDPRFYIVVGTLLLMDLLDTIGTLVGAATSSGMIDKKTGKVHNINKALMADAIGTTVGALCGTSTTTTFVESSTGILEGGRTGLTSFTVAILFFVSLLFSPVFLIIPPAATTSALFLVGVMMLRTIVHIELEDFTEAMPSIVTILFIPFSSSISVGIVFGLLSFVIIKLFTGHHREISLTVYILSVFFILQYILPQLNL